MNAPTIKSLLTDLLGDAHRTQIYWQAAALLLIMLAAWLLARWMHTRLARPEPGSAIAAALVPASPGALFPLLAGFLGLVAAHAAENADRHANLVRIAAVLFLALGGLRLASYAIERVFKTSGSLRALQRIFALVVWAVVALHVTGLLPAVQHALEIPVYGTLEAKDQITLYEMLKAAFGICVALVVALWLGTALDSRLTRMDGLDASLKVALSRFARALLLVIAVLASMEAVGIPLGVLSVFGGALGVGLGLGLQRIASNYVSGFIILLDRSLRIGDLITVDKYSGTVAQIRTRYTVVQALDGTESIIPNEQLVSNTVVNHSYTSTKMRVAIKLTVAGDSDVDRAIEIMCAAAKQEQRVLTDPPPMATLAAFAADGLELELGIWFADPELGTGTVRSDISRRILAEFRRVGIKFATPARDIRLQGGPQGGLQGAASTPAVDADASNRQ